MSRPVQVSIYADKDLAGSHPLRRNTAICRDTAVKAPGQKKVVAFGMPVGKTPLDILRTEVEYV